MNNQPGRILIADDDRMQRMLLTRTLVQQGHTVEAVTSGHEAIEKLIEQPFDAVLCDITMPGMDGFEVLERIMSDDALKEIPVIMVSGFGEMAGVVTCIEMGAADYLHKPADPSLLRARLDSCLAKKRWHEAEVALRKELEEKYELLQKLETLRDSLTHMIVHDLRTPLTSVITGLQTIECLRELSAEQKECLDMSIQGGETLLGMINDLLDISRMEAGVIQLNLAEIAAPDLVERALRQVASLAQEKQLNISTEIMTSLPPLQVDGDKLLRTLVNLLGNAIKFTPQSGQITVEATLAPLPEVDTIIFRVVDTGEGIPPEAFDRIFEKFGQVESRSSGIKSSTGLGLTFCKMAVEAHGGRIWVESEPGQGSVFAFAIPCRASSVATTSMPSPSSSSDSSAAGVATSLPSMSQAPASATRGN
jgi:two-component system sensor histidine kinase/response regulator